MLTGPIFSIEQEFLNINLYDQLVITEVKVVHILCLSVLRTLVKSVQQKK